MINMYFHTSDPAKNKMVRWFKRQHLGVQIRNILQKPLSKAEITQLFLMSDNGTDDLLAQRSKAAKALDLDSDLTFNQMIDTVQAHPQILKNPIVFDEHSLITGFNLEKVGVFIPQTQRKRELLSLFGQLYKADLI
ncbi:ArsC/Spx/MgsR family protein [Loigolactobacillus zhaoyuanensis]|uniref:ArsC/Spx/MgsR family protein n=1 Tax=Loigolactobacillus zhaoyuanensis TaxID=2486017 RepID=A0ABW8UB39_9LACO|nr:ArsC/Spx/MgsR family protein [Loigolactobacillus zhaoyuanensis]